MTDMPEKTLRELLKGCTQLRDQALASAPGTSPEAGWETFNDDFLDGPLPENWRYERLGNRLVARRVQPGGLHWYVYATYELR